jgi:hypothetical protein
VDDMQLPGMLHLTFPRETTEHVREGHAA